MNKIIDELFDSDMNPWRDLGNNRGEKDFLYHMRQNRNALQETMTEEQKVLFQRYIDACEGLSNLREAGIFKTGFRLGVGLAFGGLTGNDQ